MHLEVPVLTSGCHNVPPAPPPHLVNPATEDTSSPVGDDVVLGEGRRGERDGEAGEPLPAKTANTDEGVIVGEGRATWRGEVLTPLRMPLFLVEIIAQGDKGQETFAFTQKVGSVKEMALTLIDKAVASTQVRIEPRAN